MKVTVRKSTEPLKFEPIDLIIKIETEEELEVIKALVYTNIDVPEAVNRCRPKIKIFMVRELLEKIESAIFI